MTGAAPPSGKNGRLLGVLRSFGKAWWLGPSVVALIALWLRYRDLSTQVVLDDEWHSLFRASSEDLVTVATKYARIATSIPLNVYNKVVLELWGFSEVSVRLLSIGATLATLLVFPWVVFQNFGSLRMALVASVLFACSPFWIFYGMSGRPYAAYFLLLLVAYHALHRTLTGPGFGPPVTFAVSGAFAVYFHLYALPALGILSLLGLGKLGQTVKTAGLRSPEARRLVKQGVLGFGLFGAILVVLLLPPTLSGVRLPATKEGQFFDAQFAREAVELLTGARFPFVAWLLCLGALSGIWFAIQKNKTFMAILGLGLLGSMAVTLLTRPNFFHVALVTWRYNVTIFVLYFVGLAAFVDAGIGYVSRSLCSRFPRLSGRSVKAIAALALGGLLIATSPIPRDLSLSPNNFRLHSAYQESYSGWDPTRAYVSAFFGRTIRRDADDVPESYSRLAEHEGGCRLVEFPYLIGDHQNPFYFYQLQHRCEVIVGISRHDFVGKSLHIERHRAKLKFERVADVEDIAGLRRKNVDFVVVHLDLERELRNRARARPSPEIERVLELLAEKLGEPVLRDPWVRVFSLARRPR
jgi:hypothetical protein